MDFEKQDSSSKEGVNGRIFSDGSLPEGLFMPTDAGEFWETHRGLKSRHIQFLALGTYFFHFLVGLRLMYIYRWMYRYWIVCGLWPGAVPGRPCPFAHVVHRYVFDYLGCYE
jgi:hypothetical protein